MHKPFAVAAFVTSALLIYGAAVAAGGKPSVTFETCAALMPPGKRYGFEISGTADTTGDAPRISGHFSVSDPALPFDLQGLPEEAKAFVDCLSGLIK